MEVYILDSLLRRSAVIDRYVSLIWTERFNAFGDFELMLHSTPESRKLLPVGTLLASNVSHRVMTIETFVDNTDAEGKKLLTVKGRSLEAILEDRVARHALVDMTAEPKWILTGAPAAVVRSIFHDICVAGTLNVGDKIPFIFEGTIMPDDTIAEPVDPITIEVEPAPLYDVIKQICDVWSLGFRLLRNLDSSQLWFDVYSGNDRTTSQTILPAVVFAPELDNLQNTTQLTTRDGYKNVAYVFSPAGFLMVYPPDVAPDTAGFDRHVMVVRADDITSDNPDVPAALLQRGTEALSKQRQFTAFDGEIDQNSLYKYGTDYLLGDLVELRNTDGVTNVMRVTEQIFVSDEQGERSYPTLAMNLFIDTGSWLSWESNQVWEDLGLTDYWAGA